MIRLDADLLIYRAGFAAERAIWFLGYGRFTEEGWEYVEKFPYKADLDVRLDQVLPARRSREKGLEFDTWAERELEPVENCLHNVRSMIEVTATQLQAHPYDDIILFLSGPTNFRDGIAKSRVYKGNREILHKPTHTAAIKDYMAARWELITSVDEEGDDTIAIEHLIDYYNYDPDCVLASTDKDLNMIPGVHYNFVKDERYVVTPQQGLSFFFKQLLMGDPSDNIPGLPGCGPKTADKLIGWTDNLTEQWDIVRLEYERALGTKWEEYLLEQALLLWIRREPNQFITLEKIRDYTLS
jgi:hypothetical protein